VELGDGAAHLVEHRAISSLLGGAAPLTLSVDDTVTLFEILVILLGIAITWVIYRDSGRAELPGEAAIPDPNIPEDLHPTSEGRSF
jgi:hypothetical protein